MDRELAGIAIGVWIAIWSTIVVPILSFLAMMCAKLVRLAQEQMDVARQTSDAVAVLVVSDSVLNERVTKVEEKVVAIEYWQEYHQ